MHACGRECITARILKQQWSCEKKYRNTFSLEHVFLKFWTSTYDILFQMSCLQHHSLRRNTHQQRYTNPNRHPCIWTLLHRVASEENTKKLNQHVVANQSKLTQTCATHSLWRSSVVLMKSVLAIPKSSKRSRNFFDIPSQELTGSFPACAAARNI